MSMPRFLLLLALLAPFLLPAQSVVDPFEDGTFMNPSWTGDTLRFLHDNGQLQNNGPADSSAILSIATPIPAGSELEWRLSFDCSFAPSSSNFARFYLSSDVENLESSLQGYFVQAGESGSNDSYDLFRQDGNSVEKIIDGIDEEAGSGITAVVRVRRSASGLWTLETDHGSGTWTVQGDSLDNTYAPGGWMGIQVVNTKSRSQSFRFDDCYAGPWEVDLTAPEIVSIAAQSDVELTVLFSESVDSLSMVDPSNYVVDQGIGGASSAGWQSSTEVRLTFPQSFTDQVLYSLTATNIRDLAGNQVAAGGISSTFTYTAPIQYYSGMVRFNEIFYDPTPVVGLPQAEYLELLNLSDEWLNMEGWMIGDAPGSGGSMDAVLMNPGAYLLVLNSNDTALFNASFQTILSPWLTLSNSGRSLFLTAPDGTLIDSITYKPSFFSDASKANGGFSLELINPQNFTCPPVVNWDGSVDPDGGTPGGENALYDSLHNQAIPQIVRAEIIADNQLRLCFDLPMDLAQLDDPQRYLLEGFAAPDEVMIEEPLGQCVTLIFGGVIPTGQAFTLRIQQQFSCFNNGFQETSVSVVRGVAASIGDVLINECMPDESPSVGLPEAEYVEIYNASGNYLDLNGGSVSDGGTPKAWGNVQLAPDEYAIIVDVEDSLLFASYGKVIAVGGMPSLNNAGDRIMIMNAGGVILDEIRYDDSWYRDQLKSEGGWSIEKINPLLSGCNLPGNWRASEATSGGTPGAENSVNGSYQDIHSPELVSVGFEDGQTILLRFNEQLGDTVETETSYLLQPLGLTPLVATLSEDQQGVFLLFDQEIPLNTVFTLIMQGLSDCTGNVLTDSVTLGRPVSAAAGDLLLSEILFNPFSGGADFVEIFNASSNVLDLNELFLGEIFPGTDSIFNSDRVSQTSVLILPGEYRCLTRDVEIQLATYLPPGDAQFHEMSGFPSYDDREGEVVLYTENGDTLDRFLYLDDYHYPDLRNDDGVSLERLSFSLPTQQVDNWHSAASTVRFATPGYENSQAQGPQTSDEAVSVSPAVITPDADGVDDILNITYDFQTPGMNAQVTILDRAGRPVKIIRQQELLGTGQGSFFWDGRMDNGQKAPIGAYVLLFEVSNQQSGTRDVYKRAFVVGS